MEIIQNAYVVADMEKTCRRLHAAFGIGPFYRMPAHPMYDVRYRGAPVSETVMIDVAFAQMGEVALELIQQVSPGPSAYRDSVPEGELGFHHVARWAEDYEGVQQSYIDAGYEVAMDFSIAGTPHRGCYLDTREDLGHMVELLPPIPALLESFAMIRAGAADWDGDPSTLIRPLGVGTVAEADRVG